LAEPLVKQAVFLYIKLMRYWKLFKRYWFYLMVAAAIFIFIVPDYLVKKGTAGLTYDNLNAIPAQPVGLVLGTARYTKSGLPNLYFKNRINAASELYQAGKIDFLIVSGDNSRQDYDEPTAMQTALIELGVPKEKIFLDYAGFRTNDSIIRAQKIFGQNKFVVISQKFHNQRALYIAKHYNIEAIGYNAEDVYLPIAIKVALREKLARAKLLTDLLINRQPKYLGPVVEIK